MTRASRPLVVALFSTIVAVNSYVGCDRTTPPNNSDASFEPRIPAPVDNDPLGELKPEKFVWLKQNWSAAETQEFYLLQHGSQLIPYSWFLHLERPEDGKPFRSNENLSRFRFLPQRESEGNKDALPVGFVKDADLDWVGLNCAACHTNQINFRRTAIRIDGGPAAIDLDKFLRELVTALEHTLHNEQAFHRFSAKCLGTQPSAPDIARLKLRLAWVTKRRQDYNRRNLVGFDDTNGTPRSPWGHARIDAFGAILNQVTAVRIHEPKNARSADAPVSIPFLWDTPFHERVQWNGAATNSKTVGLELGALGRNGGEVLGVFGELRIDTDGIWPGYESSLRFKQLGRAEQLVTTLWSPEWPGEIFQHQLVQEKIDRGHELYRSKKCVMCHFVIKRDDKDRVRIEGDPNIPTMEKMLSISVGDDQHAVKTDPKMASNFAQDRSTGDLKGVSKSFGLRSDRFGESDSAAEILGHVVMGAIIHGRANDGRELRPEAGEANLEAIELQKYKARPLNGIWATAPFLHNGSVPSLSHLLSADRPTRFILGDREFDPITIGFKISSKEATVAEADDARQRGLSVVDTSLPGSDNSGHIYGVEEFLWTNTNGQVETIKPLTDAEREDLLEYLRSL